MEMSSITRAIHVRFEHRVYFTRGIFNCANSLLQSILAEPPRVPKVLVVLDEGLAQARPELARSIEDYFAGLRDQLKLVGPPLVIEGGERAKMSYFHVSEIHSQIERHHIDRHSYVLGIGGGALLDVVGLAAATAHRGVRLVRIPTTVLSQNDSGVGVKNGINAFGKKNFIGTFAPPFAVANDFDFLATLTERDKRSGYAEAVKVALARDRLYFESLEADADLLARFEPEAMRRMIYRSAELHVNHIAAGGDPFESGSARPLDFGHWAAHKIEQTLRLRGAARRGGGHRHGPGCGLFAPGRIAAGRRGREDTGTVAEAGFRVVCQPTAAPGRAGAADDPEGTGGIPGTSRRGIDADHAAGHWPGGGNP